LATPGALLKPVSSQANRLRIVHYGTGDVEFTIASIEEFEEIKKYIEFAYNKVGG